MRFYDLIVSAITSSGPVLHKLLFCKTTITVIFVVSFVLLAGLGF